MNRKNTQIYNLLFEKDIINTPESSVNVNNGKIKARKALDSVDNQIDALILRYEASSIRESDIDSLSESLKNKSLKFLFEQDEEESASPPPPEAASSESEGESSGGDSEPPTPEGSEKMETSEMGEESIPDLDIDAFAARTVRLISNYKSLLRMEEAIVNRVKHFLDENYGDKFVQRYIEILENQFGISISEFEDERQIKDDDFAIGAYAGGTGGLGGGG